MNDHSKTKAQLIAELQATRQEKDKLQKMIDEENQNPEKMFFRTKFFSELFHRSPMSIQILDKNGVSLAVNEAHTRLFKAVPYRGYNLFHEKQLLDQGFGPKFEMLKKGVPINLLNSTFNPHLSHESFPDNLLYLDGYAFAIMDDENNPLNFIFMHKDITERRKLEIELQQKHSQLIESENKRETERSEISTDIHDEFAQLSTYYKIVLVRLLKKIKQPSVRADIQELYELNEQSHNSVIRMLSSLFDEKFENFGLKKAIESYCSDKENRTGIKITTHVADDLNLPHKFPLTIYKILREALTNIVKHANAANVLVTLQPEGQKLYFSVMDDGIGIDEVKINSPLSLGINGMKERAHRLNGDFSIVKNGNNGTLLKIHIPLQNIPS
ncbi:MAG: ATP-binding protein [Bacteroidota bacterium]